MSDTNTAPAGTVTADDQKEAVVRLGSARGGWWWQVGWRNTPWSLIILYLGGALGVNTWLMKGFLDTIPKDLDESARVDGATHAQIFFGIILPLITPILAVTGLLGFIAYVNEFLIANVFLTDPTSRPSPSACGGWSPGNATTTSGCSPPGRCWRRSRRCCCSRSCNGSSSVG
jgi:ABC-type sugar transport system permease subunit